MSARPLVISDLDKHYRKGQPVLRSLSLSVDDGDAMALVGVNGAGKTTLIKSILDFISIEAGRVEIFGQPHTIPAARRNLAYLPERFQPPYYQTGHDFLRMMARLYRVDYHEAEVAGYFDAVDLPQEALHQPVREYSKGMAQKLGLIACLASGRRLLMLDEPMSGLDPKARFALKNLLKDLGRQQRTLFFSTHLLADVSAVCNKLAILHEGTIRFVGSPEACCRQFDSDDLETAYMRCIGALAI